MPRRQFQADLQKATSGLSVAVGVSNVQPGADDGEFTFNCIADGQQLKISALVTDVSDYPSSHTCMIFAGDNASASVAAALNGITDAVTGKTIPQILELVSNRLRSTDGDGDSQMLDSQAFDFDEDDDEEDDEEEEYFPGDEDMLPKPRVAYNLPVASGEGFTEATSAFLDRVRTDLLLAKSEGFKVGHLGGLMKGLACYVSLAIRISKLGISEEAMKAWQVEPSEYLVAIFHYPAGYKSMDDMRSYDAQQARRNFGIRIGICTTYKPTIQEAIAAFAVHNKEEEKQEDSQQGESQNALPVRPRGFRNSFVSRPLNEVCDQRFAMLLKYRYGGMPWQGAELFYNEMLLNPSHAHQNQDATHAKYYEDEHVSNTSWPKIVTADHITSVVGQQHSLPLVGMQFVLRHFVRCTEFCLICFSKMPDDLQAIKPYVCDNPLCLYQYMSLGFGPSIEHEIISQPKVVDLLVSFCYASARGGRLKDFPTGLSLAVPPPISTNQGQFNYSPGLLGVNLTEAQKVPAALAPVTALTMRYNAATLEMLFEDSKKPCPVAPGSWIVIRMDGEQNEVLHCRVIDTSLHPSVKLSEPIVSSVTGEVSQHPYPQLHATSQSKEPKPKPRAPKSNHFRSASFYIYNNNFDDLPVHEKQVTISTLLDQLPSVQEMRKYLLRTAQSTLSSWVDRLSPAVLGILRWIIASNRACILQVDEEASYKAEERVCGMSGWAQFRFAMGAPDKERRFIQAVRDTKARLKLQQYPTIFAWHGSPLFNWHGIIREGLHFKETQHGRAYGHGVYHALNVNTSLGYSVNCAVSWPKSELKIQQALALNEIVNAPQEYVSQNPHLVVAQLDWIQTRYLFVKTRTDDFTNRTTPHSSVKPLESIEQDPARTPVGVDGPIIIPVHAIAASRRTRTQRQPKRRKASGKSQYDSIEIDDDDDTDSVATLDEDLRIFEDDTFEDDFKPQLPVDSIPTPNSLIDVKGKSKMAAISSFSSRIFGKSSPSQKSLTDYVPGTLDYSSLPMLEVPAWATTSASKRLMKDFKEIISIQKKEPLHELGWHIDEDKIENIYQWIVELHSFDPKLPLAQDMKRKNIKSIVLELRFGKDHPMSPPFVRVIRPRFLGFAQGGGGHVTAGGAMCMELLTNDGWSAVSSIESVLLQVRMAISSVDPKPARLAPGGPSDYGVGEAVEAYVRACAVHGWTVPAGFREMALGGKGMGTF
ncbi:hypothetical protein yc1106_08689 [Curvularia clavata]|uniref:UBC core domain-containing protein n=1 Tax=Curvularia clavata TaxID=95742 RepID=A0A9Q9DWY1_CURCL|nr:hypothetical protein yc1106_08689 [Curvularia clavata]